jgi:hypothetical protein
VDHLNIGHSTTALTSSALRAVLETAVFDATLEAHFERHPGARPTLAEVIGRSVPFERSNTPPSSEPTPLGWYGSARRRCPTTT